MKQSPEAVKIVFEIRSRLAELPVANTPSVRKLRREISRQVTHHASGFLIEIAQLLLREDVGVLTFMAYELVSEHKPTFASLGVEELSKLGARMNSWASVDCFALYLSGPVWLHGRVPDQTIVGWAHSDDFWWRRAALVSTVALSRRGLAQDVRKVVEICVLLATDREDMVVKALSWALRELAKKHPEQVKTFIAKHRTILAARVIREVENKLRTGRKSGRSIR